MHVSSFACAARRLEGDYTWDSLLSTVDAFCFAYTLARGPWCLEFMAAASGLQGSRSVLIEPFVSAKGCTCVSSNFNLDDDVCYIHAQATGLVEFYRGLKCIPRCGACLYCMVNQQVRLLPASKRPIVSIDLLYMPDKPTVAFER